jgi:4-azaleucine resistance transporter AzlC
MPHTASNEKPPRTTPVIASAFRYSIPVLMGYVATGAAFGLLVVDAGYPAWLSPVMGVLMYAGAGQYIALGLFAAGAGLAEAFFVQAIVNARHLAYGWTMLERFRRLPFSGGCKRLYRFYLIYALTDETFALLSALDKRQYGENQGRFMLLVTLLNQSYWLAGSVIGAAAGALIPFNMEGISFALTALFIVLMIEQILRIKKPGIFVLSAAAAVLSTLFLPQRVSLLAAIVVSFCLARALSGVSGGLHGGDRRC